MPTPSLIGPSHGLHHLLARFAPLPVPCGGRRQVQLKLSYILNALDDSALDQPPNYAPAAAYAPGAAPQPQPGQQMVPATGQVARC